MAVPDEVLIKPIAWKHPSMEALLRDLQANILKGHGRPNTRHLLLRFHEAKRQTIRSFLARAPLTSALDQLQATDRHRATNEDGGTVSLLMLSSSGYRALDIAAASTPTDPAFREGMVRAGLDDETAWEVAYRQPIDGMLMVADSDLPRLNDATAKFANELTMAGIEIVAREDGSALFRDGHGIEHFGYVDGRSQPLMLEDEVNRELSEQGEPFTWDPQFGPLEVALVRDPGGTGEDSYGSYFVYRKLEQNVARFHEMEAELAAQLDLMTSEARELAGAYIVGRFRDGTPALSSKRSLAAPEVANNFTYTGDGQGLRCPFQAHIRKTNPRGDSGMADERLHLMPRRGIPYGVRAPDLSDRPEDGVGLLFMAYNRDIGAQFEFTQRHWADNSSFARPATGRDPIIGQGEVGHDWPKLWDDAAAGTVRKDIEQCVTMRGGEYFFAPSLSFLRSLTA